MPRSTYGNGVVTGGEEKGADESKGSGLLDELATPSVIKTRAISVSIRPRLAARETTSALCR